MSDLVERLRTDYDNYVDPYPAMAADEIERLRAVYEAAKEVVSGTDQPHAFSSGQVFVDVGSVQALRRALAAVEGDDA